MFVAGSRHDVVVCAAHSFFVCCAYCVRLVFAWRPVYTATHPQSRQNAPVGALRSFLVLFTLGLNAACGWSYDGS
ncbi:hypothetical protein C0081_09070 [Cohaesibacter celericrescens]|uniref:Uncharacterized protein n=1 Tax=Cohaesibacter celericrescens TaxID=2067669 RepID=A0A2N5XSH7_9HYPH|nr:hypothetical protein C0081_09070 [Cohaesibacter celericrescens]